MKPKIIFLLVLSLALLALASCETPAQSTGPDRDENAKGQVFYTFTDDAGIDITLAQRPQKVAVLFSSYADIWQTAGGVVAITVGESVQRGLVGDGIPVVDSGAGKTIDVELLYSYQPDLILCSKDIPAQADAAVLANAAGIPAAQFHVESFDDYLRMLKICTDITGQAESYETFGLTKRERIEAILSDARKQAEETTKTVLFIRAGSTNRATKAKGTKDHFAAAMLAQLGAQNIADKAPILLDGLSMEEILLQDPDVLFITTMGKEQAAVDYMESLLQKPEWQSLNAVKNKSYYFLPKNLFHFKPNANWDEAYAYLYALLYPSAAVPDSAADERQPDAS